MSSGVVIRLLAAAAAFGLAIWLVTGEPRRDLTSFGRDLVRPLALPKLWRDVHASMRRGEVETSIGAARELMRYLPDWTDGYVLFAGEIAFDLGSANAPIVERVRALDAALLWIEEGRRIVPPRDRAILSAAQATFVEARCAQDPELAAALGERTGRDPADLALAYLDAAIVDAPDSIALRERRAFMLTSVVAAAIRQGDRARAAVLLDAAIEMLRRVRDPEASIPWVSAMQRIRPALHGEMLDLAPLRGDPYLAEIVAALDNP